MSDVRQLTIDWENLEIAFEPPPADIADMSDQSNYFDLQTGKVIFISEDTRIALDRIGEELGQSLADGENVTTQSMENTDEFNSLPDWQRNDVLAAAEIWFGDFSRFEQIPQFESRESFTYMEDFIETVRDSSMQQRLGDAIRGRHPFRNFRGVLAADRRLERQWRDYEISRQHQTMTEWLHSIGVVPANPEPRQINWEPLPDLRNIMFAEVRRFVRFARHMIGVERVALIGSLATDEEFPKDIDLLVTVADDCDLAELATLGRQLSGHLQSHRAGGEVFLVNPAGTYLGRTCPWRECGPGIRARCDALHCGQRHNLHDDLNSVCLKQDLVAHPPVVLWPILTADKETPADVRDQLIKELAADDER